MVKIGFPVKRYQVYTWVSMVKLFPELWKLPFKNLHGLIHIWFVVVPHQMILTFSMLRGVRELENFPMGWKKYNEMENIMKTFRGQPIGVVGGRDSGQKIKLVFYIIPLVIILITQKQQRWGRKGRLCIHRRDSVDWYVRIYCVMQWIAKGFFQGDFYYFLFI